MSAGRRRCAPPSARAEPTALGPGDSLGTSKSGELMIVGGVGVFIARNADTVRALITTHGNSPALHAIVDFLVKVFGG